jgi:glucose uptake protein GlcU
MPLAGTDYLLKLSALAVSFVGFSSVVVAIRRAIGSEINERHIAFVHFLIEGGLSVALLGLLPTTLEFTGLSEMWIWRVASLIGGILYIVLLWRANKRRRKAMGNSMPRHIYIISAISLIAILAILGNAIGFPYPPGPSAYAISITWLLVVGAWSFIQDLDIFFKDSQP